MFRGRSAFISGTVVAVSFVLLNFSLPVAAAPKVSEGSACSQAGRQMSVSSKKPKGKSLKFVCVQTIGGLQWGSTTPIPRSRSAARALLKQWTAGLSPTFLADIAPLSESTIDFVQSELNTAAQDRDLWNSKLVEVRNRLQNLNAEWTSLPSRLSSATQDNAAAKTEYERLSAVAKAEYSTLNSLLSEYRAANSLISQMFGPSLRCNFGETEYCAQAAALRAQRPWADGVVARYEAQLRRAEAAAGTSGAAFKTYEQKYAEYKALFDRQSSIQADINATNMDTSHAQGMANQATKLTDQLNERVQLLPELQLQYAEYKRLSDELSIDLSNVKVGKKGWQKNLARLSKSAKSLELSRDLLSRTWRAYAT